MSKKNTLLINQMSGQDVPPNQPNVSVIIPIYNGSEFIAETLDSVFSQTYKDYEVFLVNDGSLDTDELEVNLEPYFKKIHYIKKENEGVAAARNTAIKKARGKYLAFIDSDDIWFEEYLEKQLDAIESKKCDLIYADAYLLGEGIKPGTKYSDKALSIGNVTTESLISGDSCPIQSGTVALRQSVLDNGMYDEDRKLMGMEDFDLWFRMAKNGAKLDYQKDVLLKYRIHPKSISGNRLNILKRAMMALLHIENRYQLNQMELETVSQSKLKTQAQIDLERAKLYLIKEEFSEAINYFEKANQYYKKTKIKSVIIGLKTFPKLTLAMLRQLQPSEYGTDQTNRR